MSEAYLWWLLLDIREEHCPAVSIGTGCQDSWVIFTAMSLTLQAKWHDLVSSPLTGAPLYLNTPQVGWQHVDNSVIQQLLNSLCVASAAYLVALTVWWCLARGQIKSGLLSIRSPWRTMEVKQSTAVTQHYIQVVLIPFSWEFFSFLL